MTENVRNSESLKLWWRLSRLDFFIFALIHCSCRHGQLFFYNVQCVRLWPNFCPSRTCHINHVTNDCLVDAGSDVNQTSPQLIDISLTRTGCW